ncbi:hypothetical protein V7S43_017673 [Phytophthora oleae]|uniref:Inner centromere protein ARK-binding domain-containing protein n=1 Tax=Phytophthora oleae TaxID=2107226 RepID=A0ABD3EW71_9STRA
MSDGEDTELLERARRLCLTARQLELPVLLPGFGKTLVELEEKSVSDETTPVDVEEDKLPLIALKKHRKSLKQPEDKAKLEQEEKKKHERRVEMVKQAQERARARVARTSQLEQQQTLREAEQQQSEAVSAAEECAEKIRRAKESRRRANKRVRIQRREKTLGTPPLVTAPGIGPNPTKLNVFHRKTMRRVQTSSQKVIHSDKVDLVDSSERNEDADADQKLMERRLRLETAARLKRMKQLEENQKRQEQEEFEQGLQKFKRKLREMDRVAKGLRKQASIPLIHESSTFDTDETTCSQEIPSPVADTRCPSPVPEKLVLGSTNQDEDFSSDSDEPRNFHSPAKRPAPTGVLSPRTAEADTRRSKSRPRLPAWKQPPVPLQPTQCYSYRAIIPAYSRAPLTAPGYSTAATLISETRFRAQEISRHMK